MVSPPGEADCALDTSLLMEHDCVRTRVEADVTSMGQLRHSGMAPNRPLATPSAVAAASSMRAPSRQPLVHGHT